MININLDELKEPVLCCPNDPDDAKTLTEIGTAGIDEVPLSPLAAPLFTSSSVGLSRLAFLKSLGFRVTLGQSALGS